MKAYTGYTVLIFGAMLHATSARPVRDAEAAHLRILAARQEFCLSECNSECGAFTNFAACLSALCPFVDADEAYGSCIDRRQLLTVNAELSVDTECEDQDQEQSTAATTDEADDCDESDDESDDDCSDGSDDDCSDDNSSADEDQSDDEDDTCDL